MDLYQPKGNSFTDDLINRRGKRALCDDLYKIVSSDCQLLAKFVTCVSRKKLRLDFPKVILYGLGIVHTAIHKASEAFQHCPHRQLSCQF